MLQAKLLSMAAALRRREEVEHSERIKTRQHHLFFLESGHFCSRESACQWQVIRRRQKVRIPILALAI